MCGEGAYLPCMVSRWWRALTDWLDRHYLAALVVTTVAFLLQIFHLYWLFAAVIMEKLTGQSWFSFPKDLNFVYVVADYLEVPALISTSILYLNNFRRDRTFKAIFYVFLLNTQWLHLFWITDNFVVQSFSDNGMFSWNAWVAWVAILIDYLEVPVIIEMLKQIYDERAEIGHRMRVRLMGADHRAGSSVAIRSVDPVQAQESASGR